MRANPFRSLRLRGTSGPDEDRFGACSSAELAHQMLDMHFDRVLRHPKIHGDCFVGMAELQLYHDLCFPAGECECAAAAIIMLDAIRPLAIGLLPIAVAARMAEEVALDFPAGRRKWWAIRSSSKDEPESGKDNIDRSGRR